MSAGLPPDQASAPTSRLDRAYRLYRRRIARCRTENQQNRIHIALENYMTPAEVRYFGMALAEDIVDSPSRRWIAKLGGSMPVNRARPVEFERRGLFKGVTRYTADGAAKEQKTLIIGFAGHFHRLMLPMPWLLDCLNPALYDLIVLRDFSRLAFALGVPELGGDLFAALSALRRHVDPRVYRNTMALGTSGGGIPALVAALLLRFDKGIAVSPQDFQKVAANLKANGLGDEAYAALLASRPSPFPALVLVCGADHAIDAAAASALHALMPSELIRARSCAQHAVLAWHAERGTLPAFLAKIFGQSLESRDLYATASTLASMGAPPIGSDAGPQPDSMRGTYDP